MRSRIKRRVPACRAGENISPQDELAHRAGYSRNYIGLLEQGKASPSVRAPCSTYRNRFGGCDPLYLSGVRETTGKVARRRATEETRQHDGRAAPGKQKSSTAGGLRGGFCARVGLYLDWGGGLRPGTDGGRVLERGRGSHCPGGGAGPGARLTAAGGRKGVEAPHCPALEQDGGPKWRVFGVEYVKWIIMGGVRTAASIPGARQY